MGSGHWFTLGEWQSVLKLASRYEMAEIKILAIEKMEPLLTYFSSLQVQLAKAYNIRKWLAPGLFRLAQRARPLDEEDVRLVGLVDSLKICALREKLRRCEKCVSCGEGIHSGGFGLLEIGHVFGISGSDLPNSVVGGEQNCKCPLKALEKRPNPPNPKDPKHSPAAIAPGSATFCFSAKPASTHSPGALASVAAATPGSAALSFPKPPLHSPGPSASAAAPGFATFRFRSTPSPGPLATPPSTSKFKLEPPSS